MIISKLKSDQWDKLSKQASKIRDELGNVYSYLLRERDFLLTVNTRKVQPLRPCVWDSNTVSDPQWRARPAIIEIDQPLAPAKACLDCGWWNKEWAEECEDCQSRNLELRNRRIWGWIGVQRYLHKSDYGIDFLRNGRKILISDKRLFFWEDPNGIDPPELEYPIDSPRNRGRIVGEIHCDHVPVNYQKDAFVYDNPEWKTVVRTIRGTALLARGSRRRLGLPRNTSQLAQLYAGYRREDQGLITWSPRMIWRWHWAKLFRDGDPLYQTDDLWYQLAYAHDHPVTPQPKDAAGDVFGEMGLGERGKPRTRVRVRRPGPGAIKPRRRPRSQGIGHARRPNPDETLDQRLDRYRASRQRRSSNSRAAMKPPALAVVELTAWTVEARSLTDPQGNDVPIFAQMTRAPKLEVFVAIEHPLLTEYGIELRDLVMTEVAEYMRVRGTPSGREPKPLSAVLFDIKSRAPGAEGHPGCAGKSGWATARPDSRGDA